MNTVQPIGDAQWQTAFDKLHNASDDRKLIVGRLGVKTSSSSANLAVVERPGYYYVSTGLNGELGQAQARDGVGVALTAWQTIWMVRENGELVICRATNYGGGAGGGGVSNLDALTDVTLSAPSNGQTLQYNSTTGQWVNATVSGGGGATILDGLIDVTITTPANKQVLQYNTGTAQWVNRLMAFTDLDFTGSDIASITTRPHSSLQGINPNDHHHIAVSGAGITVSDYLTQVVDITLAANSGLIATGGLRLNPTVAGAGLTLTAGIMDIAVGPGLLVDTTTITLNPLLSGLGLTLTAGVLDVGAVAGSGIDLLADSILVDVTDFIDTTRGLYEPTPNDIGVRLETNSGFQFGGAGGVQLGTPSTLAVASVNSVTTNTHSHAITSSSDQQFGGAALLASNASGFLALAQLTIRGGLIFAGGDQSITASNKLTIAPAQDLLLDPGGLVLAPNAQDIRTVTINDLPTGIDGFRLWNRYANYTQLSIGAIKADELYVRVFTADETRIDRGEEYWSKSFGIVQSDFNLPAVGATVDVWFEDAPAAVTFNLFAVNDYLLMRTIDWTTGLVVQKVWFQVTVAKLAQETTAANGVDRQQWRIRRLAGGSTGLLIKRGNLALDSGQINQGWIHLSALSQDGGPFIQIGTMTSVATVPQFTNYVRMGNLNGTVDYATNVYGFAAGSSLGTTPSGGFSGMTAEATNGLRLFNTTLELYEAGNKVVRLAAGTGLAFEKNSLGVTSAQVAWYDDLGAVAGAAPTTTAMASISLGRAIAAVENTLNISSGNGGVSGNLGSILLGASQAGAAMSMYLEPGNLHIYGTDGITDRVTVTNAGRVGIGQPSPSVPLHVVGAVLAESGAFTATNSDPATSATFRAAATVTDMRFLAYGSSFAGNRGGLTFADAGEFIVVAGNKFLITTIGVTPIHFLTNATVRMTMAGAGNIGIATTTPSANLHIVGTATPGETLRVERNLAAANTDSPVVNILQSHSGDDQDALTIVQAANAYGLTVQQTAAAGVGTYPVARFAYNPGVYGLNLNLILTSGLVRYSWGLLNNSTSYPDMLVFDRGNIGVGGQQTPGALLHVGSGTPTLRTEAGLWVAPNATQSLITLRNSGGTEGGVLAFSNNIVYMGSWSNSNLSMRTNNADRMTIDTAGLVGIGNTAPSTYLHIGSGTPVASSYPGLIVAPSATVVGLYLKATGGQEGGMYMHSNNNGYAGTWSNNPFILRTNNADRIWLTAAGLMGVNNTAPSSQLDVGGVIRSTANTGAPTTGTGLQMYYTPSFGSIAVYTPATSAFGELRIDGSLMKLNAASDGQVGVGTAAPVGELGVEASAITGVSSTIYSSNFNTFNGQPHFMARSARGTKASFSGTAGGDAILALEGYGYNSSAAWMTVPSVAIYGRATQAFNSGQTNGGGSFEFYTRADSTAGNPTFAAMTIDQSGNAVHAGNLTINNKGVTDPPGGLLKIVNLVQTTATGTLSYVSAGGISTVCKASPSSRRFKKEIRELPAEFGPDFLMRLKPSIFKYKEIGDGIHPGPDPRDFIGMIAEDVMAVSPGAYAEQFAILDDEGQPEGLRYDRFTIPLIATVQQQQGRIVELERKLAELERRLLN